MRRPGGGGGTGAGGTGRSTRGAGLAEVAPDPEEHRRETQAVSAVLEPVALG